MNNQQSDASRACEQHREPSIGLSDVYTSQVEFPTGFYDEFRDKGHVASVLSFAIGVVKI